MTTLLKIYFPFKDEPETLLPIEVDIVTDESFEIGVSRIKQNFDNFVAQILEENKELEIETSMDKCKFEKVVIEELNINDF